MGAIVGGFVWCPVGWIMGAWHACRARGLGVGAFRVLLAAREMIHRRSPRGRGADFGFPELARITGTSTRRVRSLVRRLTASGLVEWSSGSIGFPALDQLDGNVDQLANTIGAGKGSVAIPRRLLRHLARGASAGVIATALGTILRCLSRRRGGWDARGRVKASWIASTFGVSERRVKAARAILIAIGWIALESTNQAAENRWGRVHRIDLQWGSPASPLPPSEPRPVVTPCLNQDPLQEEIQNQEPARHRGPDGGTGFQADPPGGSKPSLADVRSEDLRDPARLEDLHRQAVGRGLVSDSEAGRLRLAALAEHAAAIGTVNPPGLFVRLLKGQLWDYATQADEDAARRRLRAHQRPPVASPGPPPATSRRSTFVPDESPGGPSRLSLLLGQLDNFRART